MPAAGVDGCKGGWVAVSLPDSAAAPLVTVAASFEHLLDCLPPDTVFAVDMPIGLPDFCGRGGRGPEALVRPLLGQRQSSVFSVPARAAVYADTAPFTTLEAWYDGHRRASALARTLSDPSRGVSIQAYGLFSRIRELDAVLRAQPELRGRVIESHPELAFWRLNGDRAMALPKKVKNRVHAPGMAERRTLLARHGFDPVFLQSAPPRGAGEDDFLDACVMLLIAERHARGETISFPSPPAHDAYGLEVAIRV